IRELKRVLVDATNKVMKEVPQHDHRIAYAATGLSTHSCRVIHDHILANQEDVRRLLRTSEIGQTDGLIELLLPICLQLAEMQTDHTFSGSYKNLLKRWIDGTEIRDLIREFGNE